MIRRALFCTLSKALQRYCGKFAKTTEAYSRTDDDSLFVLEHSLVLRVELSLGYVSRSRLSHIRVHRFCKCYYLF